MIGEALSRDRQPKIAGSHVCAMRHSTCAGAAVCNSLTISFLPFAPLHVCTRVDGKLGMFCEIARSRRLGETDS